MESHTFALLAKSLAALNMVFSVHYGNFLDDTSHEYVNKCCHE